MSGTICALVAAGDSARAGAAAVAAPMPMMSAQPTTVAVLQIIDGIRMVKPLSWMGWCEPVAACAPCRAANGPGNGGRSEPPPYDGSGVPALVNVGRFLALAQTP